MPPNPSWRPRPHGPRLLALGLAILLWAACYAAVFALFKGN